MPLDMPLLLQGGKENWSHLRWHQFPHYCSHNVHFYSHIVHFCSHIVHFYSHIVQVVVYQILKDFVTTQVVFAERNVPQVTWCFPMCRRGATCESWKILLTFWYLARILFQGIGHGMKLWVSWLEIVSFMGWNCEFHGLKLWVSRDETVSFTAWNCELYWHLRNVPHLACKVWVRSLFSLRVGSIN